jgi:hypothetical protein
LEWLKIKYFKSYLILFFFVFCVISGISLVAADSSVSTIYVSLDGNDSWDGLSATYNGTSGPKLTIKNATNTVSSGGTVIIADGTYSGSGNSNITIDKNLIIKGSSRSGTIIDGSDSNNIFNINAGCTVTVSDLTITNGKAGFGGGIFNLGTLTVNNCEFTQCKTIYKYLGGGSAICSGDDSTLNVKNSFFTSNDASLSTNGGGTIYTNGIASIENSNFIGNHAYGGAGIYLFSGNMDIEGCKFINNTAISSGGALNLYTDTSTINVHNSVFINNIANNPISTSNIDNRYNNFLNVTGNWWGSNNGPNGVAGQINDGSTWIYMNSSVDNSSIMYGDKINAEANFNNIFNNNTKEVNSADVGSILDGYDVIFSSDIGSFNPSSVEISNGTAKSTFTPNTTGVGDLNIQFGNEIITHTVTVQPQSTVTILRNSSGIINQDTSLLAYLKNVNGKPVANKTISFSVNGTIMGNVTTDSSGLANFTFKPTSTGNFIIKAVFAGDTFNLPLNNSSTLSVTNPVNPVISVSKKSGTYNAPISVLLSMNKKGTIYFTTDGSTPTIKSKKYTNPIKISKNTNLRFFGIDTDNKKTNFSTVKYVIAPLVIANNPKNNAIKVSKSKNSVFTFKFSENIVKSINWNKIYVKNLKTGKMVSISKWIKDNKLYLKMVKNRYPETWYRIYIPVGSLKDNSGNKLLKSYIIKFKTRN